MTPKADPLVAQQISPQVQPQYELTALVSKYLSILGQQNRTESQQSTYADVGPVNPTIPAIANVSDALQQVAASPSIVANSPQGVGMGAGPKTSVDFYTTLAATLAAAAAANVNPTNALKTQLVYQPPAQTPALSQLKQLQHQPPTLMSSPPPPSLQQQQQPQKPQINYWWMDPWFLENVGLCVYN